MHAIWLAILLSLGGAARALADEAGTNAPANNVLAEAGWPVGEKLTYRIYWGYLPVGTAVATVDWADYRGRRVLAIKFSTVSNKAIEKLYPVDDSIESLVDPSTFLPLQFTKNLSEGSHRHYEVTTFDRTNRVANWESKLSGRKKTFTIGARTQDIPSFMYAMRTSRFAVGQREHYQVMADEKLYDLWINVTGAETLDAPPFGKVKTLKAEPEAAFQGLFVRSGKIWIWISDDKRCLAAKIEGSVPVASIRAVLVNVEGPGTDRWIPNPKAGETNAPVARPPERSAPYPPAAPVP